MQPNVFTHKDSGRGNEGNEDMDDNEGTLCGTKNTGHGNGDSIYLGSSE